MKNVGFDFTLKSCDKAVLLKLFDGFDFTKYKWDVVNLQSWDVDNNDLFDDGLYSGVEMIEKLKTPVMLIMFLEFFAFDGKVKEMESYQDYKDSDCQLMMFVNDVNYYDVYCKDEKDLFLLSENAKKLNLESFEYITEDNIHRTKFRMCF